jgi:hypothetical protein
MRLGQLARKLSVRPSELVDFLTTHNIPTDSGANTRLEDEQVKQIVLQFAPSRLDELMNEVKEEAIEAEAPIASVVEEPIQITEPIAEPVVVKEEALSIEAVSTENTEVEVIKAPKVELQGLKVIGKIELPEVKKKTTAETESETKEVAEERKPRSDKRNPRRERTEQQRPWKNPIAIQREQEAQEAERMRKEKLEREKELRTQKYLKKVKSAPTKSAKRMEETVIEMTEDVTEAPKTLWGKIVRWFNT